MNENLTRSTTTNDTLGLNIAVNRFLRGYPLISKYFRGIIEQRLKLPFPEESPLIEILFKDEAGYLERQLESTKETKNFEEIFRDGLHESDPDDKILDMLAEVSAIEYLKVKGFEKIEKLKSGSAIKTPDFKAYRKGSNFLMEVKHFRGPSFKKLRRTELQNGQGCAKDALSLGSGFYEIDEENRQAIERELTSVIEPKVEQIKMFIETSGDSSRTILVIQPHRHEYWLFQAPRVFIKRIYAENDIKFEAYKKWIHHIVLLTDVETATNNFSYPPL